jgi:hypothetical protein
LSFYDNRVDSTVAQSMIIPVSQGSPPEELVTVVGGGCGRWQICITIVSFMVILIHGLDIFSSKAATPHFVNYTCADNSGSQCLNANGSKCENFVFWKQHDVTTFTEKVTVAYALPLETI